MYLLKYYLTLLFVCCYPISDDEIAILKTRGAEGNDDRPLPCAVARVDPVAPVLADLASLIALFVRTRRVRDGIFTTRLGYLQHPCYFGFSLKKSGFSNDYFFTCLR